MEICDLTYHRPATLAEACELGEELGDRARYLAGGTDILVDLKQQRYATDHLIALAGLDELRQIRDDGNLLRIGGLVTLEELVQSEVVRDAFPALAEAAALMAAVQIRNRATIGGNFCAAVPCADTPPVCLVAGSSLRLVGPGGERTVIADDFFIGPRETVRRPGEVLAEVLIPAQPPWSGSCYQRFARRRASALAVASVAARLVIADGRIVDARVAMGAVAPVPLVAQGTCDLLRGETPTVGLFSRAGEKAATEATPITDVRGRERFRRDIVEVLTSRALHECARRAGSPIEEGE